MSLLSPLAERLAPPPARLQVAAGLGRTLAHSALAVAAGSSWLLLAFVTLRWPDVGDWGAARSSLSAPARSLSF